MGGWELAALVAAALASIFMVGWTWREARRLRRIRQEAAKTRDPGRLRYLYWLVDRPQFKSRRRGDG